MTFTKWGAERKNGEWRPEENSHGCLQCFAKRYLHQREPTVGELHRTTTCFWFRGCARQIWHAISHLKCSAPAHTNTDPQKSKWGHIHIPSIAPDKGFELHDCDGRAAIKSETDKSTLKNSNMNKEALRGRPNGATTQRCRPKAA